MIRTIVILLILIPLNLFSESVEIGKIVENIEKENIYMGSMVGGMGIEPEQYKRYELLLKSAGKDDLLNLLNHKNGVVRAYAIQGLIEKRYEGIDWYNISLKALDDESLITAFFGCIQYDAYTADFILKYALLKLSAAQRDDLEFQALKKSVKLGFLRDKLTMDQKLPDSYYPYIRAMAEKNDVDAIIALTKYGKEEDLDLILKLKDLDETMFFRILPVIKGRFKCEDYLMQYAEKILPEEHYSSSWSSFYKAVANIHNDTSLKIFNQVFTSDKTRRDIKKYHAEYIFEAVSPYKDGFYDELIFLIWKEQHLIDKSTLLYINKKYKLKSEENLKSEINFSNEYFYNTELFKEMLLLLIKYDRKYAANAMSEQVRTVNVHIIKMYIEVGENFRDDKITRAYLDRLTDEKNINIYYPIYKLLLSYKNKNVNSELVNNYKNHQDDPVYVENIKELLMEYKLPLQ